MPVSRREVRGGRAFAVPVFGIVVLLAFYWILTDWQEMPRLIDSAISTILWMT
jgi:hypothetical protein